MSSYISARLRRFVAQRASWLCEYCLVSEDDAYFGCEVDHIISEKHNGPTSEENLAYACVACNRAKGSDIGSIVWSTGRFTRLFHPRTDRWSDHFALDDVVINPRTDIGEVTARILGLNDASRLAERTLLRAVGRYPNPAARERIDPAM